MRFSIRLSFISSSPHRCALLSTIVNLSVCKKYKFTETFSEASFFWHCIAIISVTFSVTIFFMHESCRYHSINEDRIARYVTIYPSLMTSWCFTEWKYQSSSSLQHLSKETFFFCIQCSTLLCIFPYFATTTASGLVRCKTRKRFCIKQHQILYNHRWALNEFLNLYSVKNRTIFTKLHSHFTYLFIASFPFLLSLGKPLCWL